MGASKTGLEARMSAYMVIWEVMSGGMMGVQGSEGGEGIGRLSVEATGLMPRAELWEMMWTTPLR